MYDNMLQRLFVCLSVVGTLVFLYIYDRSASHSYFTFKMPLLSGAKITNPFAGGNQQRKIPRILQSDIHEKQTKLEVRRLGQQMRFKVPRIDLCPDYGSVFRLVIVCASSPNHTDHRKAIRSSWAQHLKSLGILLVFLIGETYNPFWRRKTEEEFHQHNDMVVGNFLDTYENLTVKSYYMLKWLSVYCFKAAYFLKLDDDVFVNTKNLFSLLKRHENEKPSIYGRLAESWKPHRDIKSKYYVSYSQYQGDVYPNYCTGPAYVIPRGFPQKMLMAALTLKPFVMEDVFITGIVAQSIQLPRKHDNGFRNDYGTVYDCLALKHITVHLAHVWQHHSMWKTLKQGHC